MGKILIATILLGSLQLNAASPLELADPFVLADGGKYYAYGTMAKDGLAVATSTDLQNWTIAQDLVLKKGDGAFDSRSLDQARWTSDPVSSRRNVWDGSPFLLQGPVGQVEDSLSFPSFRD